MTRAGSFKTTLNATAHAIQWVLNYPDLSMMIVQATSSKAESILKGIKHHFLYNTKFRELFPEHCPRKMGSEWGTRTEFTSEARSPSCSVRESTIMTGSIDKGSAGYHFDVMKFSDVVEQNNICTRDQIADVIYGFQMMNNLLVRPTGWIDVEGTRYDLSDLYGIIIDAEEKLKKENRDPIYSIYARGCYKKKLDHEPEFTIEELGAPDLLDAHNQPISWWETDASGQPRWPTSELEKIRLTNPFMFGCQQRNSPLDDKSQVAFPVNDEYPAMISRGDFRSVPIAFHTVTVDTADTQNNRSKYTAIVVVGWSKDGRAYVHDIRHDRFLPDDIIFNLFDIQKKYRPLTIKIEETAFVRGLMPSIRRAEDTGILVYRNHKENLNGIRLNVESIKRENDISKEERILNTLQPWYMSKAIRILDDLPCKDQLFHELSRFPRYQYNDIIDALADQFQNREYFGRYVANPPTFAASQTQAWEKLLKIEPFDFNKQQDGYSIPVPFDDPYNRTGGL